MVTFGFEYEDGTKNEGLALPEFAQEVERLGYESVWAPEGLAGGMDVLTAITSAIKITKSVKFATNVLVAPYYHPWHLAKRTLTMDLLSEGRFMLGIGVGWRPPEFEMMGLPYTERGKLTDEMLEIMIRMWENGDVSYEGRHFRINGLVTKLDPPFTKPHPKILIGGGPVKIHETRPAWPGTRKPNRDAALKRTAKYGDGWRPPSISTVEDLTYGYNKILEYAREFGRRLPERFVTAGIPIVNIQDDEKAAIEDYKQGYSRRVLPSGIYRSQGNLSMDEYSSLGAVGPVENCIHQVRERLKVPGLERIIFYLYSSDNFRQLERIHKEVIPACVSS